MNHEYFMSLAIEEAKLAYEKNEVPIGAVVVKDGVVIASAHNLREETNQAVAHAEILAIQKANIALNSWRLDTCTLYVTIEPCPMCAGAIIQSRIENIVYGAKDPKSGVHKSITNLFELPFNHNVNVIGGIKEKESSYLLSDFFKELRNK